MNEQSRDDAVWVNSNLVTENLNKIPPEEFSKYAGQYVALSLDGAHILASGADGPQMEERLRELGINPSRVIGMYIPREDEHTLI
jgi:hypothetical protein